MNFACSFQKSCSRVPLEKSRLGPAEEIARKTFFMTSKLQTCDVASTFRLVCDPQHNFPASVMCCCLLLRCDRFAQGQNLRHRWLDLSGIDQLRDLCQVFSI